MTTDSTTTGGSGTGWPSPTEPGVPAHSLQGGYHWLAFPPGSVPTVGQWSPDVWSWALKKHANRLSPKEIYQMNYLGPFLATDNLS